MKHHKRQHQNAQQGQSDTQQQGQTELEQQGHSEQDDDRVRVSRAAEQHDMNPVHGDDEDTPWKPPSNLTAPEPRPGMAQRWIRVSLFAEDDANNLAKSMQEGWKPRAADTVPASFPVPTISHGKHAGCIGVHGLILCEMPEKKLAQRRQYYADQAAKQMTAVRENQFREVKLAEETRKSEVTKGRIPQVAEE